MLAKEDQLVIVELEPGVWLTDGEGDPPRTLVKSNAKRYQSAAYALGALTRARKFRPFEAALSIFVNEPNGTNGTNGSDNGTTEIPVYLLGDQPATCPLCGARTDFESIPQEDDHIVELHKCLDCEYEFYAETEEE